MSRATAIVLTVAVLGLAIFLAWSSVRNSPASTASGSALSKDPSHLRVPLPATSAVPTSAEVPRPTASLEVPAASVRIPPVPSALPPDPPKVVKFGVILVTYAGAQDAPSGARSRQAARQRADLLAMKAQTDFNAAVAEGDDGSGENLGRVRLGDLERESEAALFSLAAGGVSGVVNTPRGYWILRRLE